MSKRTAQKHSDDTNLIPFVGDRKAVVWRRAADRADIGSATCG